MARHKQIIRVIYPTKNGKIVLRTEADWDTDVPAWSVSGDGCTSEFSVETERPFFYFKPVLLQANVMQWSRGANFLAVATSNAPFDIYPYFLDTLQRLRCLRTVSAR